MSAAEAVGRLLPELLLALVGNAGDVFVDQSGDVTQLSLSETVDWVAPPEREQLNRLARLGGHYAAMEAFVEAAAEGGAAEASGSLYRAALANGLAELLDIYRSAVLQVEQHLLHAAMPPPLLALRQFLGEFEVLLPEAHALAAEVQQRGLAGAQVMQLLAARARSGVPALQSCAQRLLWHCRQVLFKQLESWLVHGLLLDRAGEFFVQRASEQAASAGSGRASPSPLRLDALEGSATSGADWEPLEWHTGFQVSLAALPPEVSLVAAEKVLFIGKAVRVLKQPMSAAASHQALRAHAEIMDCSQALAALQAAEVFRAVEFENCLEAMRAKVSGLLWDLICHRCDLMGQFGAVKSYFLLGRGDFYQQLLDEAQALLAGPPKLNSAEADMGLVFQQAAQKSTAESDPLFGAFSLRWMDPATAALPEAEGGPPAWHPSRCASVHVPPLDTWDGVFVECAVEWPLQLLFPPEVLAKYGALWQYMFRLRRVQLALEGAWAALQELQRARHAEQRGAPPAAPAGLPRTLRLQLWQQRQRMAHFVGNLQLYLQMDVVHAGFSALRAAIAAAGDFTAADAAHHAYVDSLVTQAFLDLRQLMSTLEAALRQCMALAALVRDLADGRVSMEAAEGTLAGIARDFRRHYSVLFQLMQSSRLQSSRRAPSLRQLILRLNFNSFSEKLTMSHMLGVTSGAAAAAGGGGEGSHA